VFRLARSPHAHALARPAARRGGAGPKARPVNEALDALDALVFLAVKDRDLAAPPGSGLAEGDRYIVGPSPTGAWAGRAGQVALWRDGGWRFFQPKAGWAARIADEGVTLVHDGAAWGPLLAGIGEIQNLLRLGVGTTADATNRFAFKGENALLTAPYAAEGGSGDLRLKLNKETAADVLSLLLQSGFSGRAELGLVGDDDLVLKVSADGSVWREALRVQRASGAVTFPAAGAPGAPRNRFVNPSFQISQENGDAAGTANGYHPADQLMLVTAGSGFAVSAQRVAAATPGGSTHRVRLSVTGAKASLASGDLLALAQRIEGRAIADLRFGSAPARPIVVRFGLRAPAGTYAVRLANGAGTRSFLAPVTIAPAEAGTDVVRAIAVPGDVAGTWATDHTLGLVVQVTFAAGASLLGAAGWQGAAAHAASGATNGLASASNVFELFDCSLTADPDGGGIAPRFEPPDPGDELLRCQRFFRLVTGSTWRGRTVSGVTVGHVAVQFAPEMRDAPAVVAASGGELGFPAGAPTIHAPTRRSVSHFKYASATLDDAFTIADLTLNARL
jgi:hypothetical protein